MADYILAIDQGTTSTRAIIFDKKGSIVSTGQLEHEQIFPKPGWVEHDPLEIWSNAREVIGQALGRADITRHDIAAVGITNQRETAVVWDKTTGQPVYNAIVWQDTRTQDIVDRLAADGGVERFKQIVGLPLATYFSGTKIVWILENVEGAREKAEAGDLLFGTTDSWVLWNLTGGVDGGVHATDVTNASRTLFMDLETLSWRDDILDVFGGSAFDAPRDPLLLRGVRRSRAVEPAARGARRGNPRRPAGGDVRSGRIRSGRVEEHVRHGQLPDLQHGHRDRALEERAADDPRVQARRRRAALRARGSIAVTGSLIQWLRDNLGLISSAPEVEELAKTVEDNGGAYFVPAFSGLFAPYWRSDARGALVGLTRYVNKGHIARAALEATAFQTREVLDAVNADSGVDLTELKVDGGMIANNTLMQFQADILGVPVVRPVVAETTALGAAYAAGLAVGFWENLDDLRANWQEDRRWTPNLAEDERARQLRLWKKAVTKTFDWVDEDVK